MIILKNRIEIVDATWYHFEEHSTASTAARSSVTVEATKKKKHSADTLSMGITNDGRKKYCIQNWQNTRICGRLPLGTGRWSIKNGSCAIEQRRKS